MKHDTKLSIVPAAQAQKPRRWQFDHHRLRAYDVALEALIMGMAIVAKIPQGYGKLKDQLTRALQSQFTQTTEASARTGADRVARYRAARAEAGEAAGLLEALEQLHAADPHEVDAVLERLWNLCAMLHGLAKLR